MFRLSDFSSELFIGFEKLISKDNVSEAIYSELFLANSVIFSLEINHNFIRSDISSPDFFLKFCTL